MDCPIYRLDFLSVELCLSNNIDDNFGYYSNSAIAHSISVHIVVCLHATYETGRAVSR